MKVHALLACFAALVFAAGVHAQSTPPQTQSRPMSLRCNSYNPLNTMFSDVCWSGMFPIRLAGATIAGKSSRVPSDATNKVVCACGGDLASGQLPRVGFTVGFWAPSKIIDVTRDPYCMPSLGGLKMPLSDINFLNSGANVGRTDRGQTFLNWTMYSFPLLFMLRLMDEGACPGDGATDFDVITSSPMFPNWNDVSGRYTFFVNPEMLLFANPAAALALPVDAAASTLGHPMNYLFWAAGAWGATYPITGFVGGSRITKVEPVRASSLTAFRALSLMHRLGFVQDTVGSDNLCTRHPRFIIRKDAYRWQMLAPSPEQDGPPAGMPVASNNASGQVRQVSPPSRYSDCNHPTGSSTAGWGMWRDVPATGEDHTYLLFQWTDCCFGVYGG